MATASNFRMAYPNCNLPGHEDEPLSRIVIDEKCERKCVVCCICEELDYKGQRTIPIKTFLSKLSANGQTEQSQEDESASLNYYANEIQTTRSSFMSLIAQEKLNITQMFEQLRVHGEIYFNKIEQMYMGVTSLTNPNKIFESHIAQSAKSFKSYFAKLIKIIGNDLELKDGFSITKQIETISETCKDKKAKLSSSLNAIRAETQKNFQKILTNLDDSLVFKSVNFAWSETLKGHKVKITDKLVEQTGMESSGQRFAMIEPSVTEWKLGKRSSVGAQKSRSSWDGLGSASASATASRRPTTTSTTRISATAAT